MQGLTASTTERSLIVQPVYHLINLRAFLAWRPGLVVVLSLLPRERAQAYLRSETLPGKQG